MTAYLPEGRGLFLTFRQSRRRQHHDATPVWRGQSQKKPIGSVARQQPYIRFGRIKAVTPQKILKSPTLAGIQYRKHINRQ
jgi:hypothetical protein